MARLAGATREARAVFDVALATGDPVAVGRDLETFVSLVETHDELSRVLSSAVVPPSRKRAVVSAIAESAGFTRVTTELLSLLADRDELSLVEPLTTAYRSRVLQHQQIVEAHVTTAVPLSEDRRAALESSLGEATGKSVRLTTRVDPSILGGVVTRVGSVVFDGSVAGSLDRLRHTLAEGV